VIYNLKRSFRFGRQRAGLEGGLVESERVLMGVARSRGSVGGSLAAS
jgi:hypothetical protein